MWCEWLLGGRRAYIIQTYLCAQLSIYVHICIYRGVHMSMMIMMSMHMIHTHSNYHMHDSACMHALRICLYNVCTCMFIQSQCVDHVYIYICTYVYTRIHASGNVLDAFIISITSQHHIMESARLSSGVVNVRSHVRPLESLDSPLLRPSVRPCVRRVPRLRGRSSALSCKPLSYSSLPSCLSYTRT